MNKTFLSWNDIINLLSKVPCDGKIVYGVPKGGMIAASFLNATKTYDPVEADIILDDLIDSGKTRDYYIEKYPGKQFHALIDKKTEKRNDWIVFPWEADHPQKEDNIQENIVRQLQYIGEDCEREGLKDTPHRIVKMWDEIFRGYDDKNKPKVSIFKNGTDGLVYDQMIIDTGEFYSHCEHHMVPFFGNYWFGYIPDPNGNIIGLSKVARLVDFHAARLQIQERLVHDIVEDIWDILSEDVARPIGMGLIMQGEHLCKTMRGARKKGRMTTTKLKGAFFDNQSVKNEFLQKANGT